MSDLTIEDVREYLHLTGYMETLVSDELAEWLAQHIRTGGDAFVLMCQTLSTMGILMREILKHHGHDPEKDPDGTFLLAKLETQQDSTYVEDPSWGFEEIKVLLNYAINEQTEEMINTALGYLNLLESDNGPERISKWLMTATKMWNELAKVAFQDGGHITVRTVFYGDKA